MTTSEQYSGLVFDDYVRDLIIERCLKHVRPNDRCLTLGYQGDNWPSRLLTFASSVDIVEMDPAFCDMARKEFDGKPVTVYQSRFEDFTPPREAL